MLPICSENRQKQRSVHHSHVEMNENSKRNKFQTYIPPEDQPTISPSPEQDFITKPHRWSGSLNDERTILASNRLLCGIMSGASQATLFNPWDRAMYLSVKENRHFLDTLNWRRPYQGFFQAILHRTLSNGLYFPFESFFEQYLNGISSGLPQGGSDASTTTSTTFFYLSASSRLFFVGTLSGACCGLLLHPFSAIKYRCWGFQTTPTFVLAIRKFCEHGRLFSSLSRGAMSTVQRDIIFGGCFCYLRHVGRTAKVKNNDDGDKKENNAKEWFETPPNKPTQFFWNSRILVASGGKPPGFHNGVGNHNTMTTTSPILDHASGSSFPQSVGSVWVPSTGSSTTDNSGLQFLKQHGEDFFINFVAAGIAVSICSPWNYVRNVKFGTKVNQLVPSTLTILKELVAEVRGISKPVITMQLRENLVFKRNVLLERTKLLQGRLKIGVGTLRVALGMAFGAQIYDSCAGLTKLV